MSGSELDCCVEEVKISAFKTLDKFYEEYKQKVSQIKKPKKVRKLGEKSVKN